MCQIACALSTLSSLVQVDKVVQFGTILPDGHREQVHQVAPPAVHEDPCVFASCLPLALSSCFIVASDCPAIEHCCVDLHFSGC